MKEVRQATDARLFTMNLHFKPIKTYHECEGLGRRGAALFFIGVLFAAAGCGQLNPWVPLTPQGSTTPPSAKLRGETQVFNGKVVLVKEGYRLRLNDSGNIVRVTRAKRRVCPASTSCS